MLLLIKKCIATTMKVNAKPVMGNIKNLFSGNCWELRNNNLQTINCKHLNWFICQNSSHLGGNLGLCVEYCLSLCDLY